MPGLVSTDDIDGDGDALDKPGMVGEDDMAVMTTPGCFFLLGCFCDAGFLLEAVLLLAVELTLMLTLRAEDDRRWSRSLWRSLFERETRGGSKSPRRGSSGLVGLRSDMLRDAKDGGLLRWVRLDHVRVGLLDGIYIAIVVAPGRGIGIGGKEKREVIQMRGTG